jgi:hypothetical protein
MPKRRAGMSSRRSANSASSIMRRSRTVVSWAIWQRASASALAMLSRTAPAVQRACKCAYGMVARSRERPTVRPQETDVRTGCSGSKTVMRRWPGSGPPEARPQSGPSESRPWGGMRTFGTILTVDY